MSYSMDETVNVAKRAAGAIEPWLKRLPPVLDVLNVEDDDHYRAIDVDLVVVVSDDDGGHRQCLVEVKGDRYDHTGNFFLETISNREKGTPGCFMYTQAHLVFYYFVRTGELHMLPMPATRDWFVPRMETFREAETTTPVGRGEKYTTVGRLVPKAQLLAEVGGVMTVSVGDALTEATATELHRLLLR